MAIVYEHVRNDTNEVFYVGIGEKKDRAYVKCGRNPYWENVVNKVGYTINIIHNDIDYEDAIEIEKSLIAKYGRRDLGLGNLVNMTDGGERGRNKLVYSKDTRANTPRKSIFNVSVISLYEIKRQNDLHRDIVGQYRIKSKKIDFVTVARSFVKNNNYLILNKKFKKKIKISNQYYRCIY